MFKELISQADLLLVFFCRTSRNWCQESPASRCKKSIRGLDPLRLNLWRLFLREWGLGMGVGEIGYAIVSGPVSLIGPVDYERKGVTKKDSNSRDDGGSTSIVRARKIFKWSVRKKWGGLQLRLINRKTKIGSAVSCVCPRFADRLGTNN